MEFPHYEVYAQPSIAVIIGIIVGVILAIIISEIFIRILLPKARQ